MGLLTTVFAWVSGWNEVSKRDQLCEAAVQQNSDARTLLIAAFEPGPELEQILGRSLSEADSARATTVQMSATSPYLLARADELWSTCRFSWPLAPLSVRAFPSHPARFQLAGTSSVATIRHEPFLNPALTIAGPFDVSLLIVAAFPLAVIVLTYDLISGEREAGRLRILQIQSRSIFALGLTRCAIAVGILTVAIMAPVIALTIFAWPSRISEVLIPLLMLTLAVLAYGLAWGALAFLVNSRGASSTANGVVLVLCWGIWIVAVPSAVDLWVSSRDVATSPSRLASIESDMSRRAEADGERLLAEYRKIHPELAFDPDDLQQAIVCQEVAVTSQIRHEMHGRLHEQFEALRSRDAARMRSAWLSPAIAIQIAVDELAEASESHHVKFAEETLAYQDQLIEYFARPTFQNRELQRRDIEAMPVFQVETRGWRGDRSVLTTVLSSLCVWCIGLVIAGRAMMTVRAADN
ncbi:hypothetical protein Pan44_46200 [Caulifigura coniformis]|uniref:ABC-2 family transporter protein n=1 Tax=Caulifigura coniformis TaxID=2527983 RepID=A0A517SKC1_9PLAN|nr:DUF3526 domain-containing protein [Caulifigura coniformis]QDT56564.1 hypothetical protein Pan44_46200 [Caulifigura coniformis]